MKEPSTTLRIGSWEAHGWKAEIIALVAGVTILGIAFLAGFVTGLAA